MTTKYMDCKESMTSEVTSLIQSHARALSLADVSELTMEMPADDAMIVGIVLRRQEQIFKRSPQAPLPRWPEPKFDIDQLISVISPFRVTSFCSSWAIRT